MARRLGFARLPSAGYGSHAFLVAYDEPTDRWLKLDTVTELAFGRSFELRLASSTTADCLDRRRSADRAFVLDAGDGFWTLLLHGLLDKTTVDDATRTRLHELALEGQAGGPVATALASLLPDGWSLERVVEAVSANDWTSLDALSDRIASAWRRRYPVESTRRRVTRPLQVRVGRLARIRRPRGMAVVLVGDATVTARLASQLARDVPLPVRTPTLPPVGRSIARGLRDRQRLGQCLLIYRAATLEDLPVGWTDAAPAGLSSVTDVLSSPAPDLVILLGGAGSPAVSEEEHLTGASTGSDIRTVDAWVPGDQLGRVIGGLVWEHLAARWNALEGR